MHCRKVGRKLTRFPFKCGKDELEVVTKYKYLGLWFTEHLDFKYMAEQVAGSAHRALGLLICKSKCVGGFPFKCYTKLYQSLVQSIIDYGSCVWGHKHFSCIAAVQHRAMRSFLGLHSKTSNTAVLGEMGWTPQVILQQLCIGRQCIRYSKMEEDRINRMIYEWSMNDGCNNAAHLIKQKFTDLDIPDFADFTIYKCKSYVNILEAKLMENFVDSWYDDMNRINAKSGYGLNKLRTYRSFKFEYVTEEYVKSQSIPFRDRKALAKMRCSATALNIETGRYQNGMYKPPEERKCTLCNLNCVEDEFHAMLKCPIYEDIREVLYEECISINPVLNYYTDVEKFKFYMSNPTVSKYSAKACRQILERRRNFVTI